MEVKKCPFFVPFLSRFWSYFLYYFYSLFNTFWVLKLESKIVSKKSQKSTIFGFRKNWPFFDHFLMSFRGCFLFPFYSLFNTFWVLKLEPKIVSKKSQKSTIFGFRENWPNWSPISPLVLPLPLPGKVRVFGYFRTIF